MQINIYEAKAQLSKLIERALNGEKIIIARDHKPLVQLKPLPKAMKPRQLGTAKKVFFNVGDDFDDPLEDMKDYMW